LLRQEQRLRRLPFEGRSFPLALQAHEGLNEEGGHQSLHLGAQAKFPAFLAELELPG